MQPCRFHPYPDHDVPVCAKPQFDFSPWVTLHNALLGFCVQLHQCLLQATIVMFLVTANHGINCLSDLSLHRRILRDNPKLRRGKARSTTCETMGMRTCVHTYLKPLIICTTPANRCVAEKAYLGSQHPSTNVKTLCNFELQIWPDITTSHDAMSACCLRLKTSCDVMISGV